MGYSLPRELNSQFLSDIFLYRYLIVQNDNMMKSMNYGSVLGTFIKEIKCQRFDLTNKKKLIF